MYYCIELLLRDMNLINNHQRHIWKLPRLILCHYGTRRMSSGGSWKCSTPSGFVFFNIFTLPCIKLIVGAQSELGSVTHEQARLKKDMAALEKYQASLVERFNRVQRQVEEFKRRHAQMGKSFFSIHWFKLRPDVARRKYGEGSRARARVAPRSSRRPRPVGLGDPEADV
jgi:hypothetical protein